MLWRQGWQQGKASSFNTTLCAIITTVGFPSIVLAQLAVGYFLNVSKPASRCGEGEGSLGTEERYHALSSTSTIRPYDLST